MTLTDSLKAKVQAMDAKLNALAGWEENELQRMLLSLEQTGRVESGWREACGKTDRTAKVRREWVKVVRLLVKEGIHLTEEAVKHGNSYATMKGGFWNSIIYTIK